MLSLDRVRKASTMDMRSANRLLAAMPEGDFALVSAHLERIALERDQVLIEPHGTIDHVYFFEDGIASIVSVDDGGVSTEIGIIGRDGFSGLAAILGDARSPHRTFMQVGDATALRLAVPVLAEAMDASRSLRMLILRYSQIFFVQTAQSLVSHAHHRMEARLARWLLMCHDRLDGDEVHLTHAFMSMMIAAQRTGVTLALHVIEGAGMIRAERGRVRILDRAALVGLAGDTYGRAEAEYRRLIGPFGKGSVPKDLLLAR